MHLYEGHQGCLQQKVLATAPLAQPPHPNSPLAELNSGFLAAKTGNESGQPESRVLSPQPHLALLQPQVWVHSHAWSKVEAWLSALSASQHRAEGTAAASPRPQHSSFQTFFHRIFPNETSPFLYSLALTALTSSHFQPLPFFLNMSFLPHALHFFTVALHPPSRTLIHLIPLSSHSLFFILPSPRLPIFFTSQMFLEHLLRARYPVRDCCCGEIIM